MSKADEEEEAVADEEEATEVSAAVVEDDDDEEEVVAASVHDDDDEATTVKSEMTNDDDEPKKGKGGGKRKRPAPPPGGGGSRKGRTPAVKGLTIPFRAVKRTMKMDPDIGTVQNEAAIMTTLAAELFVKSLASQSHENAKNKGRNTIRYEDVAEARTKDPALNFLETLIP
jgi:histone H3/H4